jgi:hypothetical protein
MSCLGPGNRAAACLIVLLALCPPALSADKPDAVEQTLRQQRRDALQEVVKLRQKEIEAGRATAQDLVEPARRLFLAEQELAGKQADRLALCEKFAQVVKETQELNEARRKAGKVSDSDYALARAACLEGEVLILRERLRAKEDKEGPTLLRMLLLERREAYQGALLALNEQYDAGRVFLVLLLDVTLRSLDADLATEDKPAARWALRQATADRLAQREKELQELFVAGRVSAVDPVAAHVARLTVEINLDRERFGPRGERPEKHQRMLEDRRDDARNALEARREQFDAGRCPQEVFLDTARMLLETELALTGKGADRVALLRAYLERLKKAEEEAKARVNAGRAGPIELLNAQAARLEAEINLRRAARGAK